ncbi:glycolate oxidase subunit GlcD [Oleiphilus sp. HI0071]|uniref:FAD-linked oxidase C-terminal domain-containing protein n=2 Tax=Oleiphilus sp. HI0080 TaxID=1822255 RepID=UPI0007C2274D|nr:FAD-linked oxidase C-terminal domain-containing protein [Oleiphilus sp. HI0080]KZY74562.1 glycolate oxidase subunit GlcD [Oleiphilus sp. HI0065]KZY87833.1 glycolate oxidase subunit GlcD [Oleiphilus sp. HI0071]KZY89249.1 glycolate oxidase subunit GlcD [Oleiphilus sp. HI0073]KZZ51252.1 glycolate oxidase subunit GlcD [Oleiphilus sp. HI0122]KZZ18780.1 glycolate oxidase subunit GlcD [Oleiphilus sp. HI0080]
MSTEHIDELDGEIKAWRTSELHQLVSRVLPERCILSEQAQRKPYECDGLAVYRVEPGLVVLPESKEQVQDLMRCCDQHGIVVVPRGAGTGLSGGALPIVGAITLSLSKMNQIIRIDADQQSALVQPGVRNLAVSEAAASHGLYYAPDPSSQIACSIGGNVAENAGGVHCLKYGLTVNNVQWVELVLADGTIERIGSDAFDSPGMDLLSLLHGSEGMLGIVTEVCLKLIPIPPVTKTLLVSFAEVESAANAVASVIAAGIIPAGLEMMDKLAIQAAEDFACAGYPREAEAILIAELDGPLAQVEHELALIKHVFEAAGATEVRVADNEAQRALFWKGRKSAFPAVGRISPDYYCMDGTIPKKNLPAVLKGIAELSEKYGLAVANVFHAGDGNMHPLILFDANSSDELQRAEAMGGDILALCVKLGGAITGEHGVGREKINQMCVQFASDELSQFHALKQAFDPHKLLNPNKNIPTLARCAEFGHMHVHNGELPFPDLERF